jgi:ATP-dependent DNA ligase
MIKLNFKPQKGKAFDKLPKKTLDIFEDSLYLASIKFDGNQIFIAKQGKTVRWFTSDWKEFNLPIIGEHISKLDGDFVLVGEFNYEKVGKLGDRTIAQGKLTTERVNFKKGLRCSLNENLVFIKVFDIIEFDKRGIIEHKTFMVRLEKMTKIKPELPIQVTVPRYTMVRGKDALDIAKKVAKDGWEGIMLMEPEEYYHVGKRVNHAIKIKNRPTADLECIDVEPGEGKYEGMIGSLVLKDKCGRVVKVGSGLDDNQRGWHEDNFIGKIVEIEYEQIMDTYVQPTFIRIREDKTKGE